MSAPCGVCGRVGCEACPMSVLEPTDYDRAVMAAVEYDERRRAIVVDAATGPLFRLDAVMDIPTAQAILRRAADAERREARELEGIEG